MGLAVDKFRSYLVYRSRDSLYFLVNRLTREQHYFESFAAKDVEISTEMSTEAFQKKSMCNKWLWKTHGVKQISVKQTQCAVFAIGPLNNIVQYIARIINRREASVPHP